MKVLIVSDTHRKNDNYFKALELVEPDLVIHCGDAEGAEYVLTNAAACPVQPAEESSRIKVKASEKRRFMAGSSFVCICTFIIHLTAGKSKRELVTKE